MYLTVIPSPLMLPQFNCLYDIWAMEIFWSSL